VHTRPLWLPVALLLASRAVAADPTPPLTVPDLTGPRTLALQSGVGAYTGTEALFINPAALAARKRYTVDSFYLTDRRAAPVLRQDYLGASVVDSSTTPVAAGFGYVRVLEGVETGTLLRLGLAAPLTDRLSLGVQGNYFDLHGVQRVAAQVNVDTGLFYQVTSMVSVGAAGYNLINSKHDAVEPQAFGVGFAAGSERSLQVTGDWRIDLDRVKDAQGRSKKTNRYGIGAEYLFDNAVPIRAGFQKDGISGTNWWSVGLGWVSARAAVDLGFRQSVSDPRARTLAIAVRFFVPNE
jgi:hypothetical protein